MATRQEEANMSNKTPCYVNTVMRTKLQKRYYGVGSKKRNITAHDYGEVEKDRTEGIKWKVAA